MPRLRPSFRSGPLVAAAGLLAALALPVLGSPATAEPSDIPTVHPHLLAVAPAGASKPDDITEMDGKLWVTYQNNAGKDGTPPGSMSTIVALDPVSGAVAATYQVTGRCDGLTADPGHHRLLASVNEDNNSSLFTITPGDAVPAHYTYSPDPSEGVPGSTNGGTDAISVTPDGTIYIAHSNPDPTVGNTAAVYRVTLDGSIASLSPVFGVNDPAHIINQAPGGPPSAPLGLTDPDSNRFLPDLRGGTLVQDAQADSKLVFATHLDRGRPELRQLLLTNAGQPAGSSLTPQLDDVEQVTGPGVLYAVDQQSGNIYAIGTAGVAEGTFFASQPAPSAGDNPNAPALSVVNVRTGVVTPVDFTMGSPKGLLFIPALGGLFGGS